MKPLFQVGDTIYNKQHDVTRKIAEVRQMGYSWYYPEWPHKAVMPGRALNDFRSENSSDPFLERGWEKVS